MENDIFKCVGTLKWASGVHREFHKSLIKRSLTNVQ